MKQQVVLGIVNRSGYGRVHEGEWKEVELAEISNYWIIGDFGCHAE